MSKPSIPKTPNGATFSECGQYRYMLWRIWDFDKPLVMFVGLNPSTADAYKDDPTIRSVCRIAKALGYGGLYMMNCFPFISTDPKMLQGSANVPQNDTFLKEVGRQCSLIILAWGNFDIVKTHGRDADMILMFPQAMCLCKNKNGSPKHPLYIRTDVTPVNF